MKKVGKYIAISLLLLLGLCCVGILYLFFIPNSSLFNITYINHHKTIKTENFAGSEISKIDLNSRSYNVKILSTDTEYIYSKVYSNSFGFVLKKNSEVKVETSLSNNVLTINVTEPHGFATKNDSYIEVYIPETSELDLDLSNLNAKTTINSEKIKIKNLTYTTENGDFDFNKGEISGNLTLDISKSSFKINENVKTKTNNVVLRISKGKFYANSSKLGDINVLENTHGIISVNECGLFELDIESAGGSISISKASRLNIITSDTNVKVDEIISGANIELTQSGKVSINKLCEYSTIKTNSGDINISTCLNTLIAHTDSGNININNAQKTISIKTNSGNAVVNFAENASNFIETDTEKSRTLYATIANGTLTATGVQHIGVPNENTPETITGITITGSAHVSLKMNDVKGKNKIEGNNGTVTVVANDNSKYALSTNSSNGKVRVNLLQISQSGGYTDLNHEPIYVNHKPCESCNNCKNSAICENSVNTLIATSTHGSLTILDESMYKYGF